MRKKTYLFDSDTLEILSTLKEKMGKKETQIIREALRLYLDSYMKERKLLDTVSEFMDKIERIADQISDLSYRLGRCEERNRILEAELRKLKGSRGI